MVEVLIHSGSTVSPIVNVEPCRRLALETSRLALETSRSWRAECLTCRRCALCDLVDTQV